MKLKQLQAAVLRVYRNDRSVLSHVARGAAGGLGLKVVHTILNLVVASVLARTLSPDGYGTYTFALAVMALAAIPVQAGLPTLVLREVSRYNVPDSWGYLRGVVRRANQSVAALSAAALLATLLFGFMLLQSPSVEVITMGIALSAMPIVSFNRVREATLQGLGRTVLGQLPGNIVHPAILLIVLLVCQQVTTLSPPLAMVIYCVAALASLLVGLLILIHVLPSGIRDVTPAYDTARWLRSIGPLSLIAALQVVNSQVSMVLLGILKDTSQVALFRVAFSLSALAIFVVTVVNAATAPHMARLYRAGELRPLRKLVYGSAAVTSAAATIVLLLLVFLGKDIIVAVFGPEYESAYLPLVILGFGQALSASMGFSSVLLSMTGHEREGLRSILVSAAVCIALNAILIPSLGATGAALAVAVSLGVWRLLLAHYVRTSLWRSMNSLEGK